MSLLGCNGTKASTYHTSVLLTHVLVVQDLKDTIDVRDREGNLFYVRRMQRDCEELLMLEEFSALSEQADRYSHILPIKDKFDDPDDPGFVFIVTDLLHYAHIPSFKYVEDAMDFFEQLFEVCSLLPSS